MDTDRGGIFFENIGRDGVSVQYPGWRYHPFYEPKIVHNTDEDDQANLAGWKNPRVPLTAVPGFQNFMHDLEDMNCRQIVQYARDEYGAELPEEAGKAKLLHAIYRIATEHPKNDGQMVLLAQTVQFDLDGFRKRILEAAGDMDSCSEQSKEDVWL